MGIKHSGAWSWTREITGGAREVVRVESSLTSDPQVPGKGPCVRMLELESAPEAPWLKPPVCSGELESLVPAGESPLFNLKSAMVREFNPRNWKLPYTRASPPPRVIKYAQTRHCSTLSCPHFTEEETEAQRCGVPCSVPHGNFLPRVHSVHHSLKIFLSRVSPVIGFRETPPWSRGSFRSGVACRTWKLLWRHCGLGACRR